MSRLCVIYNMAAKYRAPIFQLMDKVLDIDWYYGYQIADIKEMDSSLLKSVTRLQNKMIYHNCYWQSGVIGRLLDKRYDRYLILGDLFALSTWMLLLLRPIVARKKKVYLWSHGWYGREGRMKKILKRILFGLAHKTFLYGNYAREQAILQGNNPKKLFVIHNSLDHDRHVVLRYEMSYSDVYHQYFGNDFPTLIFIGRLTAEKHLDMVIDAAALMAKRGQQCNIVFVGDGNQREQLESRAKSKDVRVWFYGACYDDSETASLIYNADICVSPGNVGLTAMHALSFGTPVITHDAFANQMPEFEAVRPGKTGAFFKEGDIDSLCDAILEWLHSHHDKDLIRRNCYDEIDQFWTPEFQFNVLRKEMEL